MESINVHLEAFEGPFDLLFHLIEKNEIDIYDIPIAQLTEQYIAFLEQAEYKNMDGMSEFLLMAATLIEIKSKLLLPKQKQEQQQQDPREELVNKLLEYKKFKEITEDFKKREETAAKSRQGHGVYCRGGGGSGAGRRGDHPEKFHALRHERHPKPGHPGD